MNRPNVLSSLVVTAAATMLAGCGPSWVIHSQAAPDPFANQRAFAVTPIDYTGLGVGEKTEADYMASKNPEQQASFQTDKAAMNDEYLKALSERADAAGIHVVPATGPQSAPFLIHPSVAWLEPGYYIGVAGKRSQVKMTMKITTPDGKVLDEIGLVANAGGYATGTRLRLDGQWLGKYAAEYLKMRVAGQ